MKPDWDQAPAWAEYAAQDASGDWHWYMNKPSLDLGYWSLNDVSQKFERVKHFRTTWKDSLQERPNGHR